MEHLAARYTAALSGMTLEVRPAAEADLVELADVAARTFPLACPPSATPGNVAAFIEANLSPARFGAYLADPDRVVLTVRDDADPVRSIIGYAMLIRGVADDVDVARAVPLRPAAELSKMYVLPEGHGAGVSAALMSAALGQARASGAVCVWLGVNRENLRAQRFYAKHGFSINGTKTFRLGDGVEHDYVMFRPL